MKLAIRVSRCIKGMPRLEKGKSKITKKLQVKERKKKKVREVGFQGEEIELHGFIFSSFIYFLLQIFPPKNTIDVIILFCHHYLFFMKSFQAPTPKSLNQKKLKYRNRRPNSNSNCHVCKLEQKIKSQRRIACLYIGSNVNPEYAPAEAM